jgi:hypothetical protein
VVDNLDIKLIGGEVHVFSLDDTRKLSFYVGADYRRGFLEILDANPDINIPEGLFSDGRSMNIAKNYPFGFGKNLF